MIVQADSDADWSKEHHGHSRAGRAIEVGGCLIHWGANKLSTPTTSTCEREFGALHMARSHHMVQVTERRGRADPRSSRIWQDQSGRGSCCFGMKYERDSVR